MKRLIVISALFLAGCDASGTGPLVATGPRAPVVLGQSANGGTVQQFKITRSNALGVTPVSHAAVVTRAREICPQGFTLLSREDDVTRRISGVIYTDVVVTMRCA